MTYPVDDLGNPRVDFVWGNMAMQPDDQRDTVTSGPEVLIPGNIEGNRNWDAAYKYPSEGLYASLTQNLSVGDQSVDVYWQTPTYRQVSVPADNHSVALTGYSNYPGYIPNYSGDGDIDLEAKVPAVVTKIAAQAQADIEAAGFVYASVTSTIGSTVDNDGQVKSQSPAANAAVDPGSTVTATLFLAPTVPNLVGLEDPSAAQAALAEVGLILGDTNSSEDGANIENNGTVKSQSVPAGTKVSGGSAVSIVVYDNPAVLVPDIAGMTQAAAEAAILAAGLVVGTVAHTTSGANSGNSGKVYGGVTPAIGTEVAPGTSIDFIIYWYVNYAVAGIREYVGNVNRRYLYLNGRTSGIVTGNTIVLSDTGVTNYNRPFDVISVENDDAFNTGGQKIVIQNGIMDGTGGDVTNTGTWAFM